MAFDSSGHPERGRRVGEEGIFIVYRCTPLPHLLFWQGEVRERGQPMNRVRDKSIGRGEEARGEGLVQREEMGRGEGVITVMWRK